MHVWEKEVLARAFVLKVHHESRDRGNIMSTPQVSVKVAELLAASDACTITFAAVLVFGSRAQIARTVARRTSEDSIQQRVNEKKMR